MNADTLESHKAAEGYNLPPRNARTHAPDYWTDLRQTNETIHATLRRKWPTVIDLHWEIDDEPGSVGWAYDGNKVLARLRHSPRRAVAEQSARYVIGQMRGPRQTDAQRGALQVRSDPPAFYLRDKKTLCASWPSGHSAFQVVAGKLVEFKGEGGRRHVARPFPEDLADELAAADEAIAVARRALDAALDTRQGVLESAVARSRPCRITVDK